VDRASPLVSHCVPNNPERVILITHRALAIRLCDLSLRVSTHYGARCVVFRFGLHLSRACTTSLATNQNPEHVTTMTVSDHGPDYLMTYRHAQCTTRNRCARSLTREQSAQSCTRSQGDCELIHSPARSRTVHRVRTSRSGFRRLSFCGIHIAWSAVMFCRWTAAERHREHSGL